MKVAFITSRFPYPIEKGDKLRAFQHLKSLAQKHEVYLFAITHTDISEASIETVRSLCAGVKVYRIRKPRLFWNVLFGWLSGLPASVAYFLDQGLKRMLQDDVIRLKPDKMFVQLIRASEYVRALPIPKTLDYMDVFSVGAKQRAERGNWFLRPLYRVEALRLREYEKAVYSDFDEHTIISVQDRDRLPLPYKEGVSVVSNGVDLEYFKPQSVEPRYAICFVGNLGYVPNIEAAEFLIREIMPDVWLKFPDAQVLLAGARPHRRVIALASERVSIPGYIPDIRPAYASSRVFAAPMFSGMGQQNKILEAMAMGKPCVTTTMVDKSIGARQQNAIRIADDKKSFITEIIALLEKPEKASMLGAAARRFAMENYSWDAQNKALNNLFAGQVTHPRSEAVRI